MASRKSNKQTLQLGTRVFYPAHGVADVIGLEERNFGNSPQLFFALKLEGGNKVLLPVNKVEKTGVRDLVSVATARELLERVRAKPAHDDEATSRRQRVIQYKEGLRSGAPERYTLVLQQLLFRSRSRKLARDEKSVFEEARDYFVAEIGAVLKLSRSQIADMLGQNELNAAS